LPHSHLAIRHLIRQLEDHGRRPSAAPPTWLEEFIVAAAELFEPFQGAARPGFECVRSGERWEVSVFLGLMEHVGGPLDGERVAVNFRFDLKSLAALFDEFETLRWNAFPNCVALDEPAVDLSFVLAEGIVNSEPISLQVHAGPPDPLEPSLKKHADGRYSM